MRQKETEREIERSEKKEEATSTIRFPRLRLRHSFAKTTKYTPISKILQSKMRPSCAQYRIELNGENKYSVRVELIELFRLDLFLCVCVENRKEREREKEQTITYI